MNFLHFLAAVGCLAATAGSLQAEDLLATFEGRLFALEHVNGVALDDRVIGCFRYAPDGYANVTETSRPFTRTFRYHYDPAAALAISVGGRVFWNEGGLAIVVLNDVGDPRDPSGQTDAFAIAYGDFDGSPGPGDAVDWARQSGFVQFIAVGRRPALVNSITPPRGFDDIDFQGIQNSFGQAQTSEGGERYPFLAYDFVTESVVVNGRPALPGGAAPESAAAAALLCGDPGLSGLPREGGAGAGRRIARPRKNG